MDENRNQNRNSNNGGGKDPRNRQSILIFLIVTLVAMLAISSFKGLLGTSTSKEITYDEFVKMLDEGKVEKVEVTNKRVNITPKESPLPGAEFTYFTGYFPDYDLQVRLEKAGVEYSTPIESAASAWIFELVSIMLPLLLVWVIFGLVMRKMGGGGGLMGVGKSKARVYMDKETGVTFKDVAGEEEAKESFWWGLREPAKHCWPRQWQERPMCPFSPCLVRTLWRCLWAWALPVSVISLRRQRKTPPVLFLSTR